MKIFDKTGRIVSKIVNKIARHLIMRITVGKILSFLLSFIAPERESIKQLAKMNSIEIKKLIRPPIWKSGVSASSRGHGNSSISRISRGDHGVRENLHALFTYSDPLARQVVWEIKYRKNSMLADKVGQLIFEEMVKVINAWYENTRENISACATTKGVREKIIIAPIPSSKRRRRERGFNQCEVICEAIMRCGNMGDTKTLDKKSPYKNMQDMRDARSASGILCGARENLREIFIYEPNLIAKIKDTPHQADLPREKRLKNISGSFNVPSPEKVVGKIIFIVDDVITTGKTISEAQKILTSAGAKKVCGFSIAH